jgi:thioester reductase-like protein
MLKSNHIAETKKRIFLTGATGFLGTVLLSELLRRGYTVTALVRAQQGLSAGDRLKNRLLDYDPQFPWDQFSGRNLIAVEGDTTQSRFGMSKDLYDQYLASTDMVIHNAACTALETDWESLEAINIGGTREAIEFASHTHAKALVHVSSAYVAGERTGVVREDELLMTEGFRNGYERSKAIAENEVRDAAASGRIRFLIVRPSIIVGDSRSGYMCPNHHFFDLIFRLLTIRRMIRDKTDDGRFRIPGDPNATKNFIPVDYVAKLISLLLETDTAWGKAFHLTDPAPIRLEMLNLYVRTALDWPDLVWCPKEDIKELSPLERRFFRSIKIYEKYFWQEAFFDQSQLKSVLGVRLPVFDQMSQATVDRMVKFIQAKYAGRDTARKQRTARKKDGKTSTVQPLCA